MTSSAPVIDPARPEPERTRIELTFSRVLAGWQPRPRGALFTRSFMDFFRKIQSAHTLATFSYSVAEFFDWYERDKRSAVPLPDQIRRADAIEYSRWLRTKKLGLDEFRLEKDPERKLDLAIYQTIEARPGARVDEVRRMLLGRVELTRYEAGSRHLLVDDQPGGLGLRLGCLAHRKTLLRRPTIEQIRSGKVDVGLEVPTQAGISYEVPDEVFRFWLPEDSRPLEAERSGTTATRLAALSSLWSHFIDAGENDSDERLLRINIWQDPLKQVQPQARSRARVTRAKKTPELPLALALVAATFGRSHGDSAELAARAAFAGDEPPRGTRHPSFAELRDRAMLLLLMQMGLRVSELTSLKRESTDGEYVTVLGKGGKSRLVALPTAVKRALAELTRKLEKLAVEQASRGESRAERLLAPDAPLLPAVAYWGKNAGSADVKGLTRHAIKMALRRLAAQVGITDKSALARIHPHGFRHLFAHVSDDAGTRATVIQAMLGHSSLATTGIYLEEHRPEALISEAFKTRPASSPAQPPKREMPTAEPPAEPPVELFPAPEPEARPVRPSRGLVAVGAPPSLDPAVEAVARVEGIYDANWGEKGERYKLVHGGKSEASRLQRSEELKRLALGGSVEAAGVDRLPQTYVGTASGLPWWAGFGGDLRPEIPIMSPAQASDCSPFSEAAVCKGVAALWSEWMAGAGFGPTGASALVLWLGEALDCAEQLAAYADRSGMSWLPVSAPWDDTLGKKKVVRAHLPEAIVRWFAERGSEYVVSTSGQGGGAGRRRHARVQGARPEFPSYYGSPDPILELPDAERGELLDWLSALTGLGAEDAAPRFGRTSRKDVGALLSLFCQYDRIVDDIYPQAPSESDRKLAHAHADSLAGKIAQEATRLGKSFDIKKASAERKKARKGSGLERDRRRRRYLDFVRELFGPEAAADPVVSYLASCGEAPLAGVSIDGRPVARGENALLFRDLFRADRRAGTIVHASDFARRFADTLGMHSECVGRRLARDLWELHRRASAGQSVRELERKDALVRLVTDLASYRVPCPSALEGELVKRLGARSPIPVYERWSRPKFEAPSALDLREDVAEAFEEAQDEGWAAEAFARELFTPNRRHLVPNPVWLLFVAAAVT